MYSQFKFNPIDLRIKEKIQYCCSGFSKERIWPRKAQSHFGWDWGPVFVTAGIWKDVHLKKRKYAKIVSVFAKKTSILENKGRRHL